MLYVDSAINSQIEYINSFGAIANNGVMFCKYSNTRIINFDSIQKIMLLKKRFLKLNFLFGFVAFCFIGVAFFFEQKFINDVFCYILAIIFIALGVIYKKYKYMLLVSLKEGDRISLKITSFQKDDAKIIFFKAQSKIKKLAI